MSRPFTVQTWLETNWPNTCDEALFSLVPEQGPQALIWQGSPGLVVPRSYGRNPRFEYCNQQLSAAGWPISIRQSGGGLVPQGKGIWNLSLCWRQHGKPLDLAQNAYILICQIIEQALADCGIASSAQAVQGSFCDGRFNLAVWQDHYRKIVGTAQVWRLGPAPEHNPLPRQAGSSTGWHLGLVHAVILLQVDEDTLTQRTNQVEQLLQTPIRYQPHKICSLHRLGLEPRRFLRALQHQLEQTLPPHDQALPSP